MAYKIVNDDSLTSVANAIRVQGSISGTLEFPDGFVSAIQNLSPSPTLQTKTYTVDSAGTETITADSGYDGLSSVEVSVPSADPYVTMEYGYYTENNVRKWKAEPRAEVMVSEGDTAGWVADGFQKIGEEEAFSVIPTGTTVTPTESAQIVGGFNHMMEGAVTINPIPSNYKDTTDATATADKILQGYTAYANGQKLTGTASGGITPSGTMSITSNGTYDVTQYASADVNVSGGGGASRLDLLATKSLGAISTSSTTEASIAGSRIDFDLDDVGDYEALISIVSADTKVADHHYATYGEIRIYRTKDALAQKEKDSYMTIADNTNYWVRESDMSLVSYANTASYGIYPKASASTSGNFYLFFYSKFNGTRTKTIDGTYTARIYGLKVLDLI